MAASFSSDRRLWSSFPTLALLHRMTTNIGALLEGGDIPTYITITVSSFGTALHPSKSLAKDCEFEKRPKSTHHLLVRGVVLAQGAAVPRDRFRLGSLEPSVSGFRIGR
jgi:hypothetical protein